MNISAHHFKKSKCLRVCSMFSSICKQLLHTWLEFIMERGRPDLLVRIMLKSTNWNKVLEWKWIENKSESNPQPGTARGNCNKIYSLVILILWSQQIAWNGRLKPNLNVYYYYWSFMDDDDCYDSEQKHAPIFEPTWNTSAGTWASALLFSLLFFHFDLSKTLSKQVNGNWITKMINVHLKGIRK